MIVTEAFINLFVSSPGYLSAAMMELQNVCVMILFVNKNLNELSQLQHAFNVNFLAGAS